MPSHDTRNAVFTGALSNIGTTALRLTNRNIPAIKGVLIYADSTNISKIFIGDSNVTAGSSDTTDGFPIPSDKALLVEIDNPNRVFIIATSGTANKAYWMAI